MENKIENARPYFYYLLDLLMADGLSVIQAINQANDFIMDMEQMKLESEKRNG